MFDRKFTKEEYENFVEMYYEITSKAYEILRILSKEDPKNYKTCPTEYHDIGSDYISMGGWDGCMGCYDWESATIPAHYIYDENWLEQARQRVKDKEEKERQEIHCLFSL